MYVYKKNMQTVLRIYEVLLKYNNGPHKIHQWPNKVINNFHWLDWCAHTLLPANFLPISFAVHVKTHLIDIILDITCAMLFITLSLPCIYCCCIFKDIIFWRSTLKFDIAAGARAGKTCKMYVRKTSFLLNLVALCVISYLLS